MLYVSTCEYFLQMQVGCHYMVKPYAGTSVSGVGVRKGAAVEVLIC